jgi:hypothetical protein
VEEEIRLISRESNSIQPVCDCPASSIAGSRAGPTVAGRPTDGSPSSGWLPALALTCADCCLPRSSWAPSASSMTSRSPMLPPSGDDHRGEQRRERERT